MGESNSRSLQLNCVLGTAAELIKIYPVIALAMKRGHDIRILSTGQSRENFMEQYRDFQLPDSVLQVLVTSDGDLRNSGAALKWFTRAAFMSPRRFREIALQGERSVVVVHGDTLSTLVGAWLAKRGRFRVAHIEAGLRSPRWLHPFPEEITRRMVSRLTDLHFAPNAIAEENLRRTKVQDKIVNTGGNTLWDALQFATENVGDEPAGAFAIVNVHRFENLNSSSRWRQIVEVIVRAARDIQLIMVMHPQTRQKLESDPGAREALASAQVVMRDRMRFNAFIPLLKKSRFLITDGGSHQEECSYLGHPCLILRAKTERHEGLDGPCVLSKFDPAVIERFLANPEMFKSAPVTPLASPSRILLDRLEELA